MSKFPILEKNKLVISNPEDFTSDAFSNFFEGVVDLVSATKAKARDAFAKDLEKEVNEMISELIKVKEGFEEARNLCVCFVIYPNDVERTIMEVNASYIKYRLSSMELPPNPPYPTDQPSGEDGNPKPEEE